MSKHFPRHGTGLLPCSSSREEQFFSKKWILVSHQQRLPNVGDYIRIVEAGFTFLLVKDRQGLIKAHHNVCRHRAYPLVEQQSGKASILACHYHGS